MLTLSKITVFKTNMETPQSWFSSGMTSFSILTSQLFGLASAGYHLMHSQALLLSCARMCQDLAGCSRAHIQETPRDLHGYADPWAHANLFALVQFLWLFQQPACAGSIAAQESLLVAANFVTDQ